MTNKIKIYIGHYLNSDSEYFYFETNKELKDIQYAYLNSCEKFKIKFDDHEDDNKYVEILNNPDVNTLSEHQLNLFKNIGIDVKKYYDKEGFVLLLFDFIKCSLPDLELVEASVKRSEIPKIPLFNDFIHINIAREICIGLSTVSSLEWNPE